MSENNNEADALFATRRKKQQDEEAQKAAKIAEEEKMAELERQKQEVAEEIKRLETLQALQKEQEEKKAQLEQKVKAEKAASKAPFDIKKYLPFILIGAGALVVIIVVVIIIAVSSKPGKSKDSFASYAQSADWYRQNNADKGLAYAYPSVFGEGEDEEFGEDYDIYYYYDEKSGQALEMAVCPSVSDEALDLMYSSEKLVKLGLTQTFEEETGSTDYKFEKYGDNKYYITNSLDTIGEDDYMTSIFVGKKDDMYLEAYFYVSPSDEGKSRYIDFDDILEIFDVMLTHMSIG